MKRLFMVVLTMTIVLSGCSDNKKTASPVINKETDKAAESTRLPVVNEIADQNKKPTIIKNEISGELSIQAKLARSGNETEGSLTFSNYGFVFTTPNGDEIRLPSNVILLVIVDSKPESSQETLELITDNYNYKFIVEAGYSNKLSDYVLISKSVAQY